MAIPLNRSFGAGFPAESFRSAIRSTLEMAAPNNAKDRATFVWRPAPKYDGPLDPHGRPYDLKAVVSDDGTHENVQVNVAMELVERAPHGSALGQIDAPRIKLTILDESYELVKGAYKVIVGGNEYLIDFWEPPVALFDVDVYTIHLHAVDET